MVSSITLALAYSIGAGLMNGSFALPMKHVKNWNFENIWFTYSIWAFLLLPWGTLFVLDPQVIQVYQSMPWQTWMILISGGFLFGVGQICFAQSLRSIGISLSFVLNIGLGTALGTLLPLMLLSPEKIHTLSGLTVIIGVVIIFAGLAFSYAAGHQRDKESENKATAIRNSGYLLGVILAILAGVFSAGQNFSFALSHDLHDMALSLGADSLTSSIIIWPPFLACCFIPYMIYMLYLHAKNKSFHHYRQSNVILNSFLGFVMALFWFGSLIIYSKASLEMGTLGPVIVWPLFMVLIILTSNFWAWVHNEWVGCSAIVKRRLISSIATLIIAVIVIAGGAFFSN